MELENRIKSAMASVFGIDADAITADSSPDTIDKWDSLGHMNLVAVLEEEFGLELTHEQIIEMVSYPLIVRIISDGREG